MSHLLPLTAGLAGAVLLLSIANAAQGQSRSSAHLPACFTSVSGRIAFGTIMTSPEDGDRSGVQVSFEVRSGQLYGWVRDARGELPPEKALDSLAVRGDSLYFSYFSSTPTRYSFWGRVTCRALSGNWRLFETATERGQVVTRRMQRAKWISRP